MVDYLKSNVPGGNLTVIDGRRLTEQGAKTLTKTLNVALLGAAAQAGVFPFDAQTLIDVIPQMLAERFVEMNIKAIEIGRSLIC